jgi:hypothetical protein
LRSDASATNSVDLRAPIFYDSDNTAYYVDPSSTGTSGVFAGQLVVGDGIRAATSNFITPYNLFALSDTYDSGTYYGIKYVEGSPDTIQIIGANTIGLSIGMDVGDTTASSSLRAPIFYDSNNTSYYADPASTSRLNAISINSIVGNTTNYSVYNSSSTLLATPTGINYSSAFMHFTGANSIAPYSMYRTGGDWPVPYGIGFSTGGESSGIFQQYASNGSSLGPMVFYTGNDGLGSFSWKRHTWESTTYIGSGSNHLATGLMDLDWNQNLYVYGSARAPIFYDYNDTGYYCDPNSVSRLYRTESFYFRNIYGVSTDHPFGLYFDSGESTAYAIYRESGAWNYPYPDLRIAFHTGIKLGANSGYNGIRFYTDYDMSSQVMSVNNGSDALGANNVYVNNSLQAGSSLRAPIFYDSDNTGYYADLSSTGDSIRAAGNIVAYYSDERLKTKLGNITNALKKVNQLNGFYYQANELAQSLGYKSTLEVGVSAQEVELVLPEIVKPAPIDHQYKTLDYSRLVPLLIEAIKELNLKVERLEQGTT